MEAPLTSVMISEKVLASSFLMPERDHAFTRSLYESLLFVSGRIVTRIACSAARRNVICVANFVHKPESRGNGSLVRPSRTELFPLDWSPTTTSCGRLM